MTSHIRLMLGWIMIGLLTAGCSSGGAFSLFPSQKNKLLDSARSWRQFSDQPRELEKRLLPPYTPEPGDVLFVQLTEPDAPVRLPGDQPVMIDGTINLGAYGQIVAAGKTIDRIEADIRAAIESKTQKDPGAIIVRVINRQSKVYYVLGEVNAPGAFPLNGRETVLDGILAAGGLNDKASRSNIILTRPTPACENRVVLPVCFREIVQLGDTRTNYQLAPGDRIFVPSKSIHEHLRAE